MTTLIEFILNGIQYNEINGRYYKTENGKKTRIGKAAYEEAAATFVEETNKTKVDVDDEPILAEGITVKSMWDGDTTTYMVMRGDE